MGDGRTGYLPHWSYLPGCSPLIRATAYQEVGGLPVAYKLYYEETELCVRLQKRGWKLWLQRDAVAYHAVFSQRKGIPARHFAYYFIRNNLRFWKTNFGIPVALQLPRTLYVLFREVILPLRRASTLAEFLDRLKCGLAGIWDGVLFARGKAPQFERRLFP
jgi:GT2 family glycosyltransferase